MGSTTPGFYQVTLVPREGVNSSEVEAKMNLALDWIKYARHSWLIYTNKDAQEWMRRLEELVKPDGEVFICRLDISDRQGWESKDFWEWIRKHLR